MDSIMHNNCSSSLVSSAWVNLDLNKKIVNYSDQFCRSLQLSQEDIVGTDISDIFKLDFDIIDKMSISNNNSCSVLALKNIVAQDKPRLFMFYISCKKNKTGYILGIINWLNWINYLYGSLEHNYAIMKNISHQQLKDKVKKSSDIHSFNALLPLISIRPTKLSNIALTAVYDILHPFVNRRTQAICKDYLRNTMSRLRTSLKEQTGVKYSSVFEMINNDLPEVGVDGQRCITNTVIQHDVYHYAVKDDLLESLVFKQF